MTVSYGFAAATAAPMDVKVACSQPSWCRSCDHVVDLWLDTNNVVWESWRLAAAAGPVATATMPNSSPAVATSFVTWGFIRMLPPEGMDALWKVERWTLWHIGKLGTFRVSPGAAYPLVGADTSVTSASSHRWATLLPTGTRRTAGRSGL